MVTGAKPPPPTLYLKVTLPTPPGSVMRVVTVTASMMPGTGGAWIVPLNVGPVLA
jgi:hypothetical protein